MSNLLTTDKVLSYVDQLYSNVNDKDNNKDNNKETQESESDTESDSNDSIKTYLTFGEEGKTNFPKKIHELVEEDEDYISRMGVLREFGGMDDYSFFSSTLSLINKEFNEIIPSKQIKYINEFCLHLINELKNKSLFRKFQYSKLGWKKKDLEIDLKERNNSILTLRYISDYFNLNLFIFDLEEDSIDLVYGEDKFNQFKRNIVLSFKKGFYEPLLFNGNSYWNYDNNIISKLLSIDKSLVNRVKFGDLDKFEIGEDDYSNYLKDLTCEIIEEESETSKVFEKKIETGEVDPNQNGYHEITVKENDDDDGEEIDLKEQYEHLQKNNNKFLLWCKNVDDEDVSKILEEWEGNQDLESIKELKNACFNVDIDIVIGQYKNGRTKYMKKQEMINALDQHYVNIILSEE